MPKYRVTALVTISIATVVEADTAKKAMRLARDVPMLRLCFQCAAGSDSNRDEWRTSGELDGEPSELKAEVLK